MVFLFLSLLPLLSCKKGKMGEDYYPMGIGSVWNYESSVIKESATSIDTIQKGTTKVKAEKKYKLDTGEDCIFFTLISTVTIPGETTYTATSGYIAREHNNYILLYGSPDDTEPDTILALPLEKDKAWQVNPYFTAKVIGQEDVTVKAGTYKNSWKIEVIGGPAPAMTTYSWYANGIGKVKEYSELFGYIYSSELVSATIR